MRDNTMKKIKKLLTIGLAVLLMLCMSVSFTGCGLIKLQYDKEYVYSDISFKKSKDLKLEDLSAFIPNSVVTKYKIESIEDFENMLKDNIDTYYVYKQTEGGIEQVYIKPKFDSIRVTEGYPYVANAYSFYLKSEAQEFRYGMVLVDNHVFACADSKVDLGKFYFSKGEFHYEFEFNEKFSIVYNYKLEFKDFF